MRESNLFLLGVAAVLTFAASACGGNVAVDGAETSVSTGSSGAGASTTGVGGSGPGSTSVSGGGGACAPSGSACSADSDCCDGFCGGGACSPPCSSTCKGAITMGTDVCAGSSLGILTTYQDVEACAAASCQSACAAFVQHGPIDEACNQCMILACPKDLNACSNN